jgi:hypothetical protein
MKLNLTWPASVIRASAEKIKFADYVGGNRSAYVKKSVVLYVTRSTPEKKKKKLLGTLQWKF